MRSRSVNRFTAMLTSVPELFSPLAPAIAAAAAAALRIALIGEQA